jgi:GxxExxY protein
MKENEITQQIIGASIEVHRELGPRIIEKAYEESLCRELHLRGLEFRRQQAVPIFYKGVKLSVNLWLDLLVQGRVIVDLKAKEEVTALDRMKLLTDLRLSRLRVGLIIDFPRRAPHRRGNSGRQSVCRRKKRRRATGPPGMISTASCIAIWKHRAAPLVFFPSLIIRNSWKGTKFAVEVVNPTSAALCV